MELKTHNCRNLTISQELVVSIVVIKETLLTYEVVESYDSQLIWEVVETQEVEETEAVIETKKLKKL